MLIGVPKEIKTHEYRVGLTPASAHELAVHGHNVLIETGAGAGIGADDEQYRKAGAAIAADAAEVFAKAEMIVKVKEPQSGERKRLRPNQILFTYLHLAPDPAQANDLLASGATCIAYETVTSPTGGLPLLAPMSEVAGRLSIQVGAQFLQKPLGGRGILLGGVPGVEKGRVVVLGAGMVGIHAVDVALGMGAHVSVLDRNTDALRRAWAQFGGQVETLFADRHTIERVVEQADLVIGAILVPGAAADKLVSAALIRRMRPGSVVVDVAIDQGGCFATSHATTHDDPVYVVDGVIHYCVANMPGAVPRTSTYALNNATLPFVLALADRGLRGAIAADMHLRNGVNVAKGFITHKAVATALAKPYRAPESLIG